MDLIDPFDDIEESIEVTGWEPVLGGQGRKSCMG